MRSGLVFFCGSGGEAYCDVLWEGEFELVVVEDLVFVLG